jgi:hypothetical protein
MMNPSPRCSALATPGRTSRALDLNSGERRSNGATPDARLDLGGWSVSDDPTTGHQDDSVGVGVGFFEVVGGKNDGFAPGRDATNRLPEVSAPFDVQCGRGLVQDEHLGIRDEGDRHADSLGLAAGELGGRTIGELMKSRRGAVRRQLQGGADRGRPSSLPARGRSNSGVASRSGACH